MNDLCRAHETLLARPFKHKITRKWNPNIVEIFKNIKRPVIPIKNRRLDMVANPKGITPKYEPPDIPSTTLSRAVLEATLTPRLDHLSRPFVRVLKAQRKEKKFLGKQFTDTMTERIAMSLDTIYYHTVKSLMNIAAQKKRSTKSLPAKKAKRWDEDGDPERTANLAHPKKIFLPRPIRRKKKRPVDYKRIEGLSIPLSVYEKPIPLDILFQVKEGAKTYVATPRVKELCKIPAHRLKKPYMFTGKVPQEALEFEMTPRLEELSVPRKGKGPDKRKDDGEKDDPYAISPGALKYKATPRIINLAKPVER